MEWYEQTCKDIGKVNGDEIELKKELVYEGNESEWCITIHSMSSVKEKVDRAMQSMKFSEKSHVKYISFVNSTRNERIGSLQLNKYINIRLKYECLEEVGILDEAEYQGKKKTLAEIIIEARKEGKQLFHGIE